MAKKPLAVLFTDLHIKETNIDICYQYFQFLFDYIKKNNIEYLFFLGDLSDNRKGLSEQIITFIINIFDSFKEINIPKIFIPGNHDKFNQNSIESYLNFLPYIDKNIKLIKSCDTFELENNIFYLFPYFEGEEFEFQLKKIIDLLSKEENKKKILLGHYMYNDLPIELTKYCDKILLGHNHDKEEFPKGLYIGSCIQQNFAEDTNKGFSILYNDLSIEQIKFESKEYFTQVIDLNIFTEEKVKEFILDFIQKYPNKYLRIEFVGVKKDISELKDFCKQNGVNVVSKIDNQLQQNSENGLSLTKLSNFQIIQFFEEYTQENNIDLKIKDILKEILTSN